MTTHARTDPGHGRWAIIAVAALAGWVAPQAAQGNAITDVDQSLLSAIRTGAPSPPVASRDIAMVSIAMYDAVNAATGLTYQPYSYSGGAVPLAMADAAAYYAGYSNAEEPVSGAELDAATPARFGNQQSWVE
jgi:hypothetical protein